MTLTWNEVKDLAAEATELVLRYRIAHAAYLNSPMALQAIKIKSLASHRLVQIGDKLTASMVCGYTSINTLIDSYAGHGYRPTLRGKPGSPEAILADLYDLVAEIRGLEVRAYRG